MKPTTMNSKCFSGARGLSPARMQRRVTLAHTPARNPAALEQPCGVAPRLSASGNHLGYVEAPPASESASESKACQSDSGSAAAARRRTPSRRNTG